MMTIISTRKQIRLGVASLWTAPVKPFLITGKERIFPDSIHGYKDTLGERIIRIKIREITDGVEVIAENLPSSVQEFRKLGRVKDGIYKRIECAIEDVFAICAILNTDLAWP